MQQTVLINFCVHSDRGFLQNYSVPFESLSEICKFHPTKWRPLTDFYPPALVRGKVEVSLPLPADVLEGYGWTASLAGGVGWQTNCPERVGVIKGRAERSDGRRSGKIPHSITIKANYCRTKSRPCHCAIWRRADGKTLRGAGGRRSRARVKDPAAIKT